MLADDLRVELGDAGAIVLGPVGTVADAIALIGSADRIDGAVLDVNLGGEMIFPVADLLGTRGVNFVLTTGYDASSIPARFAHVILCERPVNIRRVTLAIGGVMKLARGQSIKNLSSQPITTTHKLSVKIAGLTETSHTASNLSGWG